MSILVGMFLKYLTLHFNSRWVKTVHQSVLKYCLIETDPLSQMRSFRAPTVEVRAEIE